MVALKKCRQKLAYILNYHNGLLNPEKCITDTLYPSETTILNDFLTILKTVCY
jgi:hypothetical protein